MAHLECKNVTIRYPVLDARSASIRNKLISIGTGGILEKNSKNLVYITALKDISLSLKDGMSVGIVGHNGAGKTTLLKALAGIYEPSLGSLQREGRVATLLDIHLGIEEDLTGYENIRRIGLLRGIPRAKIKDAIPDIEEFTELGDYLSLPTRTYSLGMRTRLAFAIATMTRPDILLIDEVFTTGDSHFQKKAEARMKAQLSLAQIVVFASHSERQLRMLCNKCILLDHGSLVAFGDTEDVLKLYENKGPV